MKISEHIEALETAGRALADAAAGAGPDADVPTCPEWRIRDLLRHVSMVHRWATDLVVERRTAFHPGAGEPKLDGAELLEYFREGHTALVEALRAAPETLDCWTVLPTASPLAFWARRQAHETTVHRADAESALGAGPGPVAAELAADGLDELLRAFHCQDGSRLHTPEPRILRLRTTDTGDVWTVHLSATEPPRTDRGHPATGAGTVLQTPDTELSGPADRLYLTLWNRLPLSAVTLTGDEDLAHMWRENSAVTWS
ncbi:MULTISPECIES: maleylpyruvate isomerase family mycothiol-dependent enzyme [unclassified Streptomyces]|uniref:maleylpyruvate isomerase family mycothiol-dependent enzyme n=1 Tax=unclassified Streptomyces TaxID=2593676 RepID=UPI001660BA6C|nr:MULTISPECIES: maleylpyruvate isomerase family mycothiol-dependent enzyme [unclassified Streptomyces]MBD0710367.1 hypothetical protein [Streptomyces sp. CBMA291]MBD0712702.1 hypothetical protein [Streptomyces sp. CBMA370]